FTIDMDYCLLPYMFHFRNHRSMIHSAGGVSVNCDIPGLGPYHPHITVSSKYFVHRHEFIASNVCPSACENQSVTVISATRWTERNMISDDPLSKSRKSDISRTGIWVYLIRYVLAIISLETKLTIWTRIHLSCRSNLLHPS